MDFEPDPKALCILSKKTISPVDFTYLKSLPSEVFEKTIEASSVDSTAKILDYIQNEANNKGGVEKEKVVKKSVKKTVEPTPFLENYNKGMFKHLWLEDVKKIHRAIFPMPGETMRKLEEFPERLRLGNNTVDSNNNDKTLSFLGIISKMLYVFGEPNKENTELALKTEETIKKFAKNLLDVGNLQKILAFKQRKDKRPRKQTLKRLFSSYLKSLYPREFKRFSEVKEASKLVFSSEFIAEQAEIEEEEPFIFETSDAEVKNGPKHEKNEKQEEFEFVNARVDAMSQEEFLEFSCNRSMNFLSLGKEAFLKFVEFEQVEKMVLQDAKVGVLSFEIEFLNYLFCRIIKEIVEGCIKSINNGVLKPLSNSIPFYLFSEKCEFELTSLKLKTKKLLSQKSSIEDKAFRLFVREFWVFDYAKVLEVFNTKIKLIKKSSEDFKINDSSSEENDVDLTIIWKNMKGMYQKYWFQRILAENQVKLLLKQGKRGDFVNEFASILYERLSLKPDLDSGFVFREWFLKRMQGSSTSGTTMKRQSQRLESIFD